MHGKIETLQESTACGDLPQKVLGGIIDGESVQICSKAMGVVLQLPGWGGESGDREIPDTMNQKLDGIMEDLKQIAQTLDLLKTELDIKEEEIIANVNDPSAAGPYRMFQPGS